jgi:HSP20 family protein
MALHENKTDMAARREQGLDRPSRTQDIDVPFRMLNRLAAEMDRVFDDFGLGRSRFVPRWDAASSPSTLISQGRFMPEMEMHQDDHDLIIRVDLPGMKKDDIKVDVTGDAIAIEGERRQEQKSETGGIYRTERSYGKFCRTIPLPEGAMAEQAEATFDDGVLEIRMPAPPEQFSRGRRLEIQEGKQATSAPGRESAKK